MVERLGTAMKTSQPIYHNIYVTISISITAP
jgi:hypothetical protein